MDLSCYLLMQVFRFVSIVSFWACIYHVSRNLSPASQTLAFTLVYSGLAGVASGPWISGDLNLIIIVVFANCCHL